VCTPSGDKYGDSKLVSEGVFMENSTSSLAVTVLQLPIVFGPYMGWSISPVAQMNGQKLLMCEGLKGMCSPLYVDDVYKATLLAVNCTESFGKRLLISDKPISWVSYYSGYSTMSETLELEVIPQDTFTELLADRAFSDTPFQRLKAKFAGDGDFRQLILSQFGVRSLYKIIKRYRGQDGVDKIKTNIAASLSVQGEQDESPLNQGLVDLFDSLPEVSCLKAKDVLKLDDYTPMAEALAETEEWLKWARLID
jgi:nucleoside-diphosphate-sugar epimerase